MSDWAQASWWAGGAMGVAALIVMLLALFRDRSRGRRRCPKCWYDMSGVPPAVMTCPECGRTQRREKRFFRTRRRWRVVVLGVVLSHLAAGTALAPAVSTGKWSRYVPSPVLRAVASLSERRTERLWPRGGTIPNVPLLSPWERVLVANELARRLRENVRRGELFGQDQDEMRRLMYCVIALGEDARLCLPELASCLQGSEWQSLTALVHIQLGPIARPNVHALARLLQEKEDPIEIMMAIFAVCGDDAEAERIVGRVLASTPHVAKRIRIITGWIVIKRASSTSVEWLGEILSETDPEMRIAAVQLLGRLAHTRVRGQFSSAKSEQLNQQIAGEEGVSPELASRALELIRRALEDEDPEVRRHAEEVLR